ncbi:Gfo/Idh/MocA family oxidoreductase [Oculatella sp. LEGE 06141]|uniref:Gfo/Idh/MocA family oxidoreductase n=1 Tax=Oculatella sp. LEGE 06141 TaxID=1828648 RepID=UPI001882EAC2|nr:Gfo/Idh/MocA family oxidoreductase [Oculatella sp. LEGE 06141]
MYGSERQDKTTRIAVFGAGRWGTHLVRNFLKHPQAQVVAIVDPHRDRLYALARQFGLDQQTALLTDWQTALDCPGLEAVAIATPATTHYSLTEAALQRGYHVLVEKPLTLELAESLRLCRLAEQQHCQLVVDHTYLFHPAVQRGRVAVQQGALGAIRYGYAARTHLGPVRQDVDALWDLAIHDIAIFNHWLGERPLQVQAQGTVWLQPEASQGWHFPRGLADLVWVKLVYASGVQAMIHLCWLNPDKQRRLCLTGGSGTLTFDELAAAPLTLQRGTMAWSNGQFLPANSSSQVLELDTTEPLQQVCSHFLECVQRNNASTISSGWVGAQLVQILNGLTRSLHHDGQAVTLTDPIGAKD